MIAYTNHLPKNGETNFLEESSNYSLSLSRDIQKSLKSSTIKQTSRHHILSFLPVTVSKAKNKQNWIKQLEEREVILPILALISVMITSPQTLSTLVKRETGMHLKLGFR